VGGLAASVPRDTRRSRRPGGAAVARWVVVAVLLVTGATVAVVAARAATGPDPASARWALGDVTPDRMQPVPPSPAPGPDASTGSWTEDCGRNTERHRNADNMVVAEGQVGAAQHRHDYVGNTSADAHSTAASLAAASTTCPDGDLSAFYWPVLRDSSAVTTDGDAGNAGIIDPASVRITYHGNAAGAVVAPPSMLMLTVGESRAVLAGTVARAASRVRWGCSGARGRFAAEYPRCPPGDLVVRTFDFPSCWDGARLDSPDHRDHVTYPDQRGVCPPTRFAVPQLELSVGYRVPDGVRPVIDAVPGQRREAVTDHAHAVVLLPPALSRSLVGCLNQGRRCEGGR